MSDRRHPEQILPEGPGAADPGDETGLAFAHPEARAAASAGDPTPVADRISLRDYVVEVEIGAFQAERDTTQRVRFNVVVEVRAPDAPLSDDVDRILSYDTLIEAIHAELAAERLNLLETLAERIAAAILRHPLAARIFVRIEKLDRVPGALGVEIMRAGGTPETASTPVAQDVAPLIVHLDEGALDDPALSAALDGLVRMDAPVVLTLGPAAGAPAVADARAARRIELLAIEQNAWALSARYPDAAVADSRTELDWAIKNAPLTVWAPPRLVLDSASPPAPGAGPADLTAWLAEQLGARRLLWLTADGHPSAGGENADPRFEYRSLRELDSERG